MSKSDPASVEVGGSKLRGTSPDICFLPLDCVGELFPYMTYNIPQIGAGERVNNGNIE